MTGLYGLQKYTDLGQQSPKMKRERKKFAFSNFQWVVNDDKLGRLARSSQPNYLGMDQIHTVRPIDVTFLKHNRIRCVISANQLERATKAIEHYSSQGGATLVYCGAGQGRTGTFTAGWAMLAFMRKQKVTDIDGMCNLDFLGDNFGVEKSEQVNAIRSAVGLNPTPIQNIAQFSSTPGFSSFPPPGFMNMGSGSSGPSGLGLPDDDNFGIPSYANFGSGRSRD